MSSRLRNDRGVLYEHAIGCRTSRGSPDHPTHRLRVVAEHRLITVRFMPLPSFDAACR